MGARTWRRGATVLAAGAGVALVLAACGGSDDDATDDSTDAAAGGDSSSVSEECAAYADYGTFDGDEVEIFSSIRDTEADLWTQALTKFQDCTGIAITWNGTGDFESQLQVRAQGGDAPDIATIPQPGLLKTLVTSNPDLVKPAPQSVVDIVDSDWSADWKAYGEVDGTFYAAPLGSNVKSYVWYSPTFFSENSLEVPESWDDLIALTDEIKGIQAESGDATAKPWCAGIESGTATGWVVTDWFEDVILREDGPDAYDQWVNHEIPFDDAQIKAAGERVGSILTNADYVNGGLGDVRSITTTAFQDGGKPILDGKCALHRQASFYATQWPDGTTVAEDGDVFAFYLPPIKDDGEKPLLVAGEFVAAFNDDPATQAVQEYLVSPDLINQKAAIGNWISASKQLDVSNVENPIDALSVELLQDPETVARFDGSDQMPAAVGSGSFWTNATDWINGSIDLDTMLSNIETSWPAS